MHGLYMVVSKTRDRGRGWGLSFLKNVVSGLGLGLGLTPALA